MEMFVVFSKDRMRSQDSEFTFCCESCSCFISNSRALVRSSCALSIRARASSGEGGDEICSRRKPRRGRDRRLRSVSKGSEPLSSPQMALFAFAGVLTNRSIGVGVSTTREMLQLLDLPKSRPRAVFCGNGGGFRRRQQCDVQLDVVS